MKKKTTKKEVVKKPTKRQELQLKIKEYVVKENMRLIDFLLITLKDKSRNNIKSLLSHHQVLVDGNPTSQFDFEVVKGDIVMIAPSRVKSSHNKSKIVVIYEDDEFLAIDKPSGLLSVATDKEKTVTAYRLATDYVRNKDPHNRLFVCHRIDKDTSGVLLFAKNNEIRTALQDDWNLLVKKREYIALVEGEMENDEGSRTSWLLETKTNLMYSSSKKGDGLKATTHYKVIKKNENFSLLNVLIDTGRKNQIRVHMKELGHMIVGDEKYKSAENPIKRLGLHARTLSFVHPVTKKVMTMTAKTPAIFEEVFEKNIKNNSLAEAKKLSKIKKNNFK